jgi:hypothetical protein
MQSKNIPNQTLDFLLILVTVFDGKCRQPAVLHQTNTAGFPIAFLA